MYTQTKTQIIEIIKDNGNIQVKQLVQLLKITPAAVHRALNKLMEMGTIDRKGSPPQVFYFLKPKALLTPKLELTSAAIKSLQDNYLYIDPTGKTKNGVDGFISWMTATNNHQKIENCIRDYLKILNEADSHKNSFGAINATERFSQIFPELALDGAYYFDFYSLIKFGKTKMGQLLLHGKQAQNKKIISSIAQKIDQVVLKIIKNEKIDAIAWAPHSIPRKIPFLPELKRNLNLDLPIVKVVKAYHGDIPVAQKSLSKLDERIKNASETMVIPEKTKYKNILLFDDAVGSGATLNEIAKKLKLKGAKRVVGFAIVGSYKGFEVIKEV